MSSNQKPPFPQFPKISIVGVRPEIYCLDFFGITRRRCEKRNREIDEQNERAWAKFRKEVEEWEKAIAEWEKDQANN